MINNPQPDLFTGTRKLTTVEIANQNGDQLSADFLRWLPDNLHIWDAFVEQTMKIIGRGFQHYSSRTIVEFMRHYSALADTSAMWKISDHPIPYLPRLFDIIYPQHAGLFEYRTCTKVKGSPANEKTLSL